MHLPFGILWYLLSSVLLRLSRFWSQVAKSRYSNLVTYVTCNTQCLPQKLLWVIQSATKYSWKLWDKPQWLCRSMVPKAGLCETEGAKAVALGHTHKRTMKRRNVEQCQRLGRVDCYSQVSTSYIQWTVHHVYPPWVHDHSTGFSLRHRSCQEAHFSLWPCQASSLPKFHLLSQSFHG